MMQKIAISLVISFLVTVELGCRDSTSLQPRGGRSEASTLETLTLRGTGWFDLDVHFGRDVKLSGTGLGLDSRLENGHHQIRCITMDTVSTLSVSFDGHEWIHYNVECKHLQGVGN